MKKRLEVQLIILLLCGLAFAAAWIGIQVARENVGIWSEPSELDFTTKNLTGLAPRSELRCSGVLVGHVLKIESTMQSGAPVFTLRAGLRNEFSSWKFKRTAFIETPVVTTVLSPSSIRLEADNSFASVSATKRGHGTPPVLELKPPEADAMQDMKEMAAKLVADVHDVIEPFIVKKDGGKSKVEELAEALSELKEAARNIKAITASIDGQPRPPGTEGANPPPIEQLLADLKRTTGSLANTARSVETSVGQGGSMDTLLEELKGLIKTTKFTVADVQKEIGSLDLDKHLRKLDSLLEETTATVATMHGKVEGFGDTFMGRMLIKRDKNPTPTPAPSSSKFRRK